MGLFDWLDPTRSWEPVSGPAPDLSRLSMQLPSLPFGSPLEAARFLGRPDQFKWQSLKGRHFTLLYAKKGFRLTFEEGKLVVVSYLVGPTAVEHASFQPSQPLAPDATRLNGKTDREGIVKTFGEPDAKGSDETCLQVFHGRGVISDFFLDDAGYLREWALYPDD